MPSRKATSLRLSGTSSLIYFNSRPHRGRQLKSGAGWICIDISTHALTEGDGNPGSAEQQTSHFNSRPHGGRPLQTRLHLRCVFHFNSRPHGGRHLTRMIRRFQCTFQLTPSRRATEQVPFGVYAVEFQLTPSRRATYKNTIFICQRTFQLTPSRRATRFSHKSSRLRGLFQLTPSWRATRNISGQHAGDDISTHALTEGDSSRTSIPSAFFISTHALTEGDHCV